MDYLIKKVILEIEGKEYEAIPVSKQDLELENSKLKKEGKHLDLNCNCGDSYCDSNGYLWICDLGRSNSCGWWRSTWRCNP